MGRKKQIIQVLELRQDFMTATELAQVTGVTTRTIRQDMKLIREQYGDEAIVVSKKWGYRLNREFQTLSAANKRLKTVALQTRTQRLLVIWRALILTPEGLNVYELAEQCYVSESTIIADLTFLRQGMQELYGETVSLSRLGEWWQLTCFERERYGLFYELAYRFLHVSHLEAFAQAFPEFALRDVYTVFAQAMNDVPFSYKYFSFIALTVDFAIACLAPTDVGTSETSLPPFVIQLQQQMQRVLKRPIRSDVQAYLAHKLAVLAEMGTLEREIRQQPQTDVFAEQLKAELSAIGVPVATLAQQEPDLLHNCLCHIRVAIEQQKRHLYTLNPLCCQLQAQYPRLFPRIEAFVATIGLDYEVHAASYLVAYVALMVEQCQQAASQALHVGLIVTNSYSNLRYVANTVLPTLQFQDQFQMYEHLDDVERADLLLATNNLALRYDNVVMIDKNFDATQQLKVVTAIEQARARKQAQYWYELAQYAQSTQTDVAERLAWDVFFDHYCWQRGAREAKTRQRLYKQWYAEVSEQMSPK